VPVGPGHSDSLRPFYGTTHLTDRVGGIPTLPTPDFHGDILGCKADTMDIPYLTHARQPGTGDDSVPRKLWTIAKINSALVYLMTPAGQFALASIRLFILWQLLHRPSPIAGS
jgi:hypothetical protein